MFLQRSNGTVLGTTFSASFYGSGFASDLVIGKLSNLVISKPKFLARLSITQLLNSPITQSLSPPVVRKSLIGLSHAVDIFFLFDGRALSIGGVQQLIAQLVDHAAFRASARIN